MPPESAAGILSYSLSRPTASSFSRRALPDLASRQLGVPPQRKRDVLADRDRVEQRGVLEQEADLAAARATAPGPSSALISSPSTNTRPASGRTRPTMCRSVTLLPVPLRPRMTKPLPAGTSNDTSSSTAPGAERLRHAVEPDGRRRRLCSGVARRSSARRLGKDEENQPHQHHVGHDDQDRREDDGAGRGAADALGARRRS